MVQSAGPQVDILLATYNGARYLQEQIDSLFAQTYTDWRVLARDDGSDDGTQVILRHHAETHPDRFILITDTDGNLGYRANFSRLMEAATADYIAFCDQDDVWLPDKLRLCMMEMHRLESAHGAERALLVHTDLKVVDDALDEIAPSFWAYQGLDPRSGERLNQLLIQNVVTGCASVMNRPLAELSLPIPPEAKAHDWWIALVAAAFGTVGFISTQTALYRQHGANTIGAMGHGTLSVFGLAYRFLARFGEHRHALSRTFAQIRAFALRFGERMPSEHSALFDAALRIPKSTALKRLFYLARLRLAPRGFGHLMAYVALTGGIDRPGVGNAPQRHRGAA